MSLYSFLAKIWRSVKGQFDGMPKDLKAAAHLGVVVTDNIKKILDSPVADVLTAIIPNDADVQIKCWLRVKIPEILSDMKLADSCSGTKDPSEVTACALKVMKELRPHIQSAVLHNLSVMIAQVVADGKLTWSSGVFILEWYYQHKFKAEQTATREL
jgi:hypothetical protein